MKHLLIIISILLLSSSGFSEDCDYCASKLKQLKSDSSDASDNAETADQEFALIADKNHKGLIAQATYDLNEPVEAPFINTRRPNMAILREQGVNGHYEMANSFNIVGFESVDVTMNSLIENQKAFFSLHHMILFA